MIENISKNPKPENLAYHLLRTALHEYQKPPFELDSDLYSDLLQKAKKQYSLEEKILASVEAQNIVVPLDLIEGSMVMLKSRFSNDAEFDIVMQSNNLDRELLWQALYRDKKVELILDRVASSVDTVSEDDAKAFYLRNQDKFFRPEQRKLRHILITINPDFPENTRDKAHSRIKNIAGLVSKNPDLFSEQARKHSECTTGLNGGLLGTVRRGVLYPELELAAFDLQCGEVSDVVETEIGFHIVMCESVLPEGYAALDDNLLEITKKLSKYKRQKHLNHWINSLSKNG